MPKTIARLKYIDQSTKLIHNDFVKARNHLGFFSAEETV